MMATLKKLSQVREGGVVTVPGRGRGIVYRRWPEDRVSGGTEVFFEDASRETYHWDARDPSVSYHGQGKLIVNVVPNNGVRS